MEETVVIITCESAVVSAARAAQPVALTPNSTTLADRFSDLLAGDLDICTESFTMLGSPDTYWLNRPSSHLHQELQQNAAYRARGGQRILAGQAELAGVGIRGRDLDVDALAELERSRLR
jgi:hypothetical protein